MLKPAMALFLICLIVTAALAFTYNITKDIIAERAAIDAENARKEVLADADSFRKMENIEDIIGDNPELKVIREIYVGLKDDQELGYVFSIVCKG
jgi:electron transport complex protein RnfG